MRDARERALVQVDGISVIVVRAWDHKIRRAVRRAVDVVRVSGAGMNVIDVESASLVAGWSAVQV